MKKIFLLTLALLFLFAVPRAAAGPSAVVQNDSSYLDSLGWFHVVGEVKNTGDVWLQFIQLMATLKDQSGATVNVRSGTTYLIHLPPGAAAGFDVVDLNATESAMIRSYSLVVTYSPATALSVKLQVSNLVASKSSLLGWYQVSGTLENTGDSISSSTYLAGTFYGADGKVVYVTIASPNQSTLPPGTKSPFTLTVASAERSNLVATYTVAAESLQYTSIPEWQWPTLMTGIMLSLALLIIRRGTRRLR